MNRLAGKIAVVTGGSSGIGLATAKRFVEEGARVFITGRRQFELERAKRLIGDGLEIVQADISKIADTVRLRDSIMEKGGHVDIIFANAGIAAFSTLEQTTEQVFDKVVDINLKGTFFTVQALLPLMSFGGSIILNTSIAASKGFPAFSVYSATKAAIRSFALGWTTDLKERRIRVNALSPGHTETPIAETAGLSKEDNDAYFAGTAAATPAGRNGTPEDIAAAALFLASDESAFVTGIELTVDGGFVVV